MHRAARTLLSIVGVLTGLASPAATQSSTVDQVPSPDENVGVTDSGLGGLVLVAGEPAAGLTLNVVSAEWEEWSVSVTTDADGRWHLDEPMPPWLMLMAMSPPCGLQPGWHSVDVPRSPKITSTESVWEIPAGTLRLDTGDLTADELAEVEFVHLGLGERGSYSVQTCAGGLDPVEGRAERVFRPSTVSIRPGGSSILATPQRVTLEDGAVQEVTLRRERLGRVDLVWGPDAPYEPSDAGFEAVTVSEPWSDGSTDARELHRYEGEGRNGTFPSSLLEQHVLPPGEWIAWVQGPFRYWQSNEWEGPDERYAVRFVVTEQTHMELSALFDPATGEADVWLRAKEP